MDDAAYDVAVIGAGIAGSTLAAELAASARVALLEREEAPGYHSTGRSAALFTMSYGPGAVRALSCLSEPVFRSATGPDGHPLLSPRGLLFVAREDQRAALEAFAAKVGNAVAPAGAEEAQARLPILKPGYVAAALLEADAADIDVHALHQLYLRRFKAAGGTLLCRAEVQGVARRGGRWEVETPAGPVRAETVVNAAGAWADEVARLAGVAPVGLVAKRRSAAIVATPGDADPSGWPMLMDIDEQFYMKPDAGKLLVSPADTTPSAPCDARPEEIDIAIAVDRVQQACELPVRRIERSWAGLRSFVADGVPVAGHAADAPGFFWLAGQGGYGIHTAPGLARVAAALVQGQPAPADAAEAGLDTRALDPGRPGIG